MLRRPPRSTRTDTLFPYTTLFRSLHRAGTIADRPGLDAIPGCGHAGVFPDPKGFPPRGTGRSVSLLLRGNDYNATFTCPALGPQPMSPIRMRRILRHAARRVARHRPPARLEAAVLIVILLVVSAAVLWDARSRAVEDVRARSEERRVGNECVRTWRFRWSPSH